MDSFNSVSAVNLLLHGHWGSASVADPRRWSVPSGTVPLLTEVLAQGGVVLALRTAQVLAIAVIVLLYCVKLCWLCVVLGV